MTESNIRATVKAYGGELASTLDQFLPKPIRKLDGLALLAFTQKQTETQLEALVRAMIRVHASNADRLLAMAHSRAKDELVVLDSALRPPHEPTIAKLLLYTDVLVCPDPILDHPLALRQVVPDHFHGRWPYKLDQLQELLLQSLDFYKRFGFPVREGFILPTAWHVAVTLQKTVQNNFIGESSSEQPWGAVPQGLTDIASSSFRVLPGEFDGIQVKLHSFEHSPKSSTSQIGVLAEGDPDFARTEMETYRVIGHEDQGDSLLVRLAQLPPENEALFDKWASESITKAAYNRMISLQSDLALATQVNGSVLTMSRTNHDILKLVAADTTSATTEPIAALALANMELPIVENVSLNQVTMARRDTAALENFRVGFRKACAAIKSEVGSAKFQDDVDAIARDTVEQGVRELQQSYRALRKKSLLDLSFSTTLVVLSFSGVSLGMLQWLPVVLGGIAQFKSILDAIPKQDELRKHPMFMLWSMTKKPFQAGPLK